MELIITSLITFLLRRIKIMYVIFTDNHIFEEVEALGFEVNNMEKLKKYIFKKMNDECEETGTTYFCTFIQQLINLAYEDGEDFIEDNKLKK